MVPALVLSLMASGLVLAYAGITDRPLLDVMRGLTTGTVAAPRPPGNPAGATPSTTPPAGGLAPAGTGQSKVTEIARWWVTAWRVAGLPLDHAGRLGAITATAVAMCESGGDPSAISPTGDYGVWQINAVSHPQYPTTLLLMPIPNAAAAIAISNRGTNFNPWTCYTRGTYRTHIPAATAAIEKVWPS